MHGQFLHTGLVAQNTPFAPLAARVDGQHGQFASVLLQHMDAEHVNACTFPGTGHPADAHANGTPGMGQALFYHFLRHGLMGGVRTFYQRHGPSEYRHVPFQDAFHIIPCRHLPMPVPAALQVRVHNRRLGYAVVHGQSLIFRTVLRMFHSRHLYCFSSLYSDI